MTWSGGGVCVRVSNTACVVFLCARRCVGGQRQEGLVTYLRLLWRRPPQSHLAFHSES